jgi:peptidoglycan/LPS O-acetylase OafA/YrhL
MLRFGTPAAPGFDQVVDSTSTLGRPRLRRLVVPQRFGKYSYAIYVLHLAVTFAMFHFRDRQLSRIVPGFPLPKVFPTVICGLLMSYGTVRSHVDS